MGSVSSTQQTFQSPEVRVVEASAGSGKTYALAKRYVQLALDPAFNTEQIPIRNILALTFTNKAAFEMKARILEFLKKIALKQLSKPQEDDILKPLSLSRDQASKRAYAVMEGVIRHYNFFQVQTIDKFINALLSGCAFKIGLTANFKIKTNSKEYLQYSLDQLIDRAATDEKIASQFRHFLHQYLYLENRSNWFPKNDILEIITTLFAQSNTYGLPFNEGPFPYDHAIKKKKQIIEEVGKLKSVLPEKTNAGFVKSISKFCDTYTKGFDIDKMSDYFAREALPINKGGTTSDDADRSWKKIRKLLREVCHSEAQSLFNPYIHLYDQTASAFQERARKDDCLFLSELNKKANELFNSDLVTVEELYYRLATRFRHYLIDEFQDTSRLQWGNLKNMAEEALSTGGSLFYVGDRKQAIYSFRGGEAALFDSVAAQFQAFHVTTENLSNNWRSQKHIVEFNNDVFSQENLAQFIQLKRNYESEKKIKNTVDLTQDDMEVLDHVFGHVKQTYKEKNKDGYVHMEYIDGDLKEGREVVTREKLVDLIGEIKKRFHYRDIAILTRGNKEIMTITGWLLKEGIPVESERTSDIKENVLIGEIISFLQFLNSPVDNNAFANFLLGDIFTKASGIPKEAMHDFLFALRPRLKDEKDFYIYTEFRKVYPDHWAHLIEEFFLNIGLYPLYELVITIYQRLGVFQFNSMQGFFMHFLELIKKNEEDHTDLQSFLDYFEELKGEDLYVNVTGSDAVKILTIHKSKGLEFPVVILPYLGMEIQIGTRSGEYQPKYVLRETQTGISLLRLKKEYRKFSDELDLLYEQEYKKIFFSELNSLYVALTRSKHELYGFIPKKIGGSFNLAQLLIGESMYTRGKRIRYEETKKDETQIKVLPASSYPDWIDFLKDEFCAISEIKNRDQRMKGEIMHFMLEHVGNLEGEQVEPVMERAQRAARHKYPDAEDIAVYGKRLLQLIAQPNMRPYFYCGKARVLTESEVIDVHGLTKRCDRLIIDEDAIKVVDYKQSPDAEDKDRQQVKEYKEILKEIYPEKAVSGTLIYFDSLEAVEV